MTDIADIFGAILKGDSGGSGNIDVADPARHCDEEHAASSTGFRGLPGNPVSPERGQMGEDAYFCDACYGINDRAAAPAPKQRPGTRPE